MLTVESPGKLFLAGEYGVLKTSNPAIVLPVKRSLKVHCRLLENKSEVRIYSPLLSKKAIDIPLNKDFLSTGKLAHIHNAALLASRWCAEHLKVKVAELPGAELKIDSDLQAANGVKYGFGSSGAVSVSLISALLEAHKVKYTKIELFKLAALSVMQSEPRASGADIAVAVFKQAIKYRSFNNARVLEMFAKVKADSKALIELVKADWELQIAPQQIHNLYLFPVFTGQSASTKTSVDHALNQLSAAYLDEFYKLNALSVEKLSEYLGAGNFQGVYEVMSQVQKQLEALDIAVPNQSLGINTAELAQIVRIAAQNGGIAKISGAGGGDCAIALAPNKQIAEKMKTKFIQHGFEIPAEIEL